MKTGLKIFLIFAIGATKSFCQSETGSGVNNTPTGTTGATVYSLSEEMPEPPGGLNAFYQYIASNIVYPVQEREAGITGKVFLKFVVEMDGSLSDISVLKGIVGCAACDQEAVRVLKNYPEKWKPGKQDGKPVRIYYNLPLAFKAEKKGTK